MTEQRIEETCRWRTTRVRRTAVPSAHPVVAASCWAAAARRSCWRWRRCSSSATGSPPRSRRADRDPGRRRTAGTGRRPPVDRCQVGGFPFLTQVADGRYEEITVDMANVQLRAARRCPKLNVVANGVPADTGDLIAARPRSWRPGSAARAPWTIRRSPRSSTIAVRAHRRVLRRQWQRRRFGCRGTARRRRAEVPLAAAD